MSDQTHSSNDQQPEDPQWLDDIQDLANRMLGDVDNGSACEQVHPIIARWYDETLEKEPPAARPAVWQAISCLATEVLMDAEGDETLEPLLEHVDEDTLAMWIEGILLLGRSLQIALDKGDLDDL